ncbi:MAG: cell division topological specificity factor MinE [Moraxella sp.]|nr:cell division topological specificity factor MinE [Moraxella sp.]
MKKSPWWSRLFGAEDTPSSADIAADRLMVMVASGRQLSDRLTADRIEKMKREIAEVVSKYIGGVALDDINIHQRKADNMDVLEMNIQLPDQR